jgi:integrase
MLPGAHRQVHRRAAGFAIYWYAWRGGPQIARFAGETLDEAEDAERDGAGEIAKGYGDARCTAPPAGVMARVVADYIAHPAYQSLRKATKATYRVWLDRINGEFGHLSEREITPEAVGAWRRKVLEKHGARAADHALRIFSRVCSFGRHPERRLLSGEFRPHAGFEALYRAPPQHGWTPEAIARLPQLTPVPVRHALLLAYNTGLRRADLVELPWSAIDHERGVIRWVTSKGRRRGRRIVIPLTPALKVTLAQIPKRSTQVLTNKHGRPWTVNSLAHAVTMALRAHGVAGSLHGLRRSAASQLAAQGLSSRRIARVMGWGENDAEAMAAIYVDEEA